MPRHILLPAAASPVLAASDPIVGSVAAEGISHVA